MARAPRVELEVDRTSGVRDCVLYQVGEYALDQTLVATENRRIVANRHRDRCALLLEAVSPLVNQFREQRAGSHWRKTECDIRLFDPRDLEDVIDQC